MVSPKDIKRISTAQLQITWSDARTDTISSLSLRQNCPCAGCAEARGDLNHSKPLSPSPGYVDSYKTGLVKTGHAVPGKKSLLSIVNNSLEEETRLEEVWGIGNYAVGCRWGDGHATGIYTFKKLRDIGDALYS